MRKNFDKILIGLLWLLTITLAACFWMNTFYGFNIFSQTHWAYLSEIQASQQPIKSDFYFSILAFIIIGITGLYLLVRPKFRKITLAQQTKNTTVTPSTQEIQQSEPITPPAGKIVSEFKSEPKSAPTTINLSAHPTLSRPLSPATGVPTMTRPTVSPTASQTPTPQFTPQKPKFNENIKQILESENYTVKTCNKLADLENLIVSLGFNGTIWIISETQSVEDLQNSVNALQSICLDTLGDTASMLDISGIAISPTDTMDSEFVQKFKNLDEFDNFIKNNPNTEPEDFDKELFDAISTYLSTVLMNIGTL